MFNAALDLTSVSAGDFVDARDESGFWLEGEVPFALCGCARSEWHLPVIVQVKERAGALCKIRYVQWGPTWDEWFILPHLLCCGSWLFSCHDEETQARLCTC